MEETKFLEARNLKNEILRLQTILDRIKKKDAKTCVYWIEQKCEWYYSTASTYNPSNTHCVNEVEVFPEDLHNEIVKLINNRLTELNKKFELL